MFYNQQIKLAEGDPTSNTTTTDEVTPSIAASATTMDTSINDPSSTANVQAPHVVASSELEDGEVVFVSTTMPSMATTTDTAGNTATTTITSTNGDDEARFIPLQDLLQWSKIKELALEPAVVVGILSNSRDYQLSPGTLSKIC